jgi:uncharacterized protein (TIGR03437 family)
MPERRQIGSKEVSFPVFAGVDQVNVRMPRSLIGRGEVDIVLMVNGKTANVVKVHIQ